MSTTLIIVYILSALLVSVLLISLGFQLKIMQRVISGIMVINFILGLGFYGYGYAHLVEDIPQMVIRTVFSVFCMFLGRNDIGTISKVELLATTPAQVIIYVVHLLALYTTASALVVGFGARLIRRLNLHYVRHGHLNLIYGANESSVSFAEQLIREKRGVVVMADDGTGIAFDARVLRIGGLLFTDEAAQKAAPGFLRQIGIGGGNRYLSVYCLDENLEDNLLYAQRLTESLAERGVSPDQTSLTILCESEELGETLLAASGQEKGFGSVMAIERQDMASRLMLATEPPASLMTFDADGRASDDMDAMVIGFGYSGQAILRRLIMNGQFEGSHFHAAVVDPAARSHSGIFFRRCPALREQYDLELLEVNARSEAFFDYLERHADSLKWVAICTGNEKENEEIARELEIFFEAHLPMPAIMSVVGGSISIWKGRGQSREKKSVFTTEVLCSDRIDAAARQINHRYHLSEGRTAAEDWKDCDYFSRESCRASADFLGAFLRAAGTDPEEVRQHGFAPEGELLDNLAKTEHLRWCAFHFCMGYQPMPDDVFNARAACWKREVEETGRGKTRPGKDTASRYHACLIPWEDLPALSAKEEAITGRRPDYWQMDRDNILVLPEMMADGEN